MGTSITPGTSPSIYKGTFEKGSKGGTSPLSGTYASGVVSGILSGAIYDMNAQDAAMFGGSFPSNGAVAPDTLFDSISAQQLTKASTTAPTFRLADYNGLNCLQYGASVDNFYSMPRANNVNFLAALDAGLFTRYVVFRSITGAGQASYFSTKQAGNPRIELSNNASAGYGYTQSGASIFTSPAVADTKLHVMCVQTQNTQYVVGESGTALTRIWLDGVCVAVGLVVIAGTGVAVPSVGAVSAGVNRWVGKCYRDLVYPTFHTPAQIWNQTKYILGVAGQSMNPKIMIESGSSLVQGVQAANPSYAKLAYLDTLINSGRISGKICNMGIGGISWGNVSSVVGMYQKDPVDIDGYIAAILASGSTVQLWACEGYNTLSGATYTAAQAADQAAQWCINRLAANPTLPASSIYLETITGVRTTRSGFAKYKTYADTVRQIPATYPALASINIISPDRDTAGHIGVAPESTAAINAGDFFPTTGSVTIVSGTLTEGALVGTLAIGMAISGTGTAGVTITGGTSPVWTLSSAITYSGNIAASFPNSVYGGYYGTNAAGSNGTAGMNTDQADGIYGSGTAGSLGDGVHLGGVANYPAVQSGYPYWADTYMKSIVSTFLT